MTGGILQQAALWPSTPCIFTYPYCCLLSFSSWISAQPKIDFDTYEVGGEAQLYAAARWICGKDPQGGAS